jgi:hypothetical protein
MIARSWRARATAEGAKAYVSFFEAKVAPRLRAAAGHRGALVLTRADEGGEVAITVLTFWQSDEAVAGGAGDPVGRAMVEPEARAALASFDEDAAHYRVAFESPPVAPAAGGKGREEDEDEPAPDTVRPDEEAFDTVRPPDVVLRAPFGGRPPGR